MNILRLRHAWPENAGFFIRHKGGRSDYIFIHFHTSVMLELNGKRQTVHPGGCIIFDKDTEAYFEAPGALIHDWMHLEGDIPGALDRYSLETDKVYYPTKNEFVTAIVRELEAEFFGRKSFYEDMCTSKLNELFMKLARSSIFDEKSENIPQKTLKSFIDLRSCVFSHLEYPWTAEEMARKVMFSPSRFYAVYREIFGISPKSDLICARLELAKNLLHNGNMSVEEVAQRGGFGSSFNFIRQFRKHTGMTPGEFRKSIL